MELSLVVQLVVVENSLLHATVIVFAAARLRRTPVQVGAVSEEECFAVEARIQPLVVLVGQLLVLFIFLSVVELEPHHLIGSGQVEMTDWGAEVAAHMSND